MVFLCGLDQTCEKVILLLTPGGWEKTGLNPICRGNWITADKQRRRRYRAGKCLCHSVSLLDVFQWRKKMKSKEKCYDLSTFIFFFLTDDAQQHKLAVKPFPLGDVDQECCLATPHTLPPVIFFKAKEALAALKVFICQLASVAYLDMFPSALRSSTWMCCVSRGSTGVNQVSGSATNKGSSPKRCCTTQPTVPVLICTVFCLYFVLGLCNSHVCLFTSF